MSKNEQKISFYSFHFNNFLVVLLFRCSLVFRLCCYSRGAIKSSSLRSKLWLLWIHLNFTPPAVLFCRYPFLPRSSMRQDAFWCGATLLPSLQKYQWRHAATRINIAHIIRWILKRNFLKTRTQRVSDL